MWPFLCIHTRHTSRLRSPFVVRCIGRQHQANGTCHVRRTNIVHCAGTEGGKGMFALICLCLLLFSKWPFLACSVMFGSVMVVWCCLKCGFCSFCWVIRKIVWWKDIQKGGEKNRPTHTSLSHTFLPFIYSFVLFSIHFLPFSLFCFSPSCVQSKQAPTPPEKKYLNSLWNTLQSLWRTWGA